MGSFVFTSEGGTTLRVGRTGSGMPLLGLHGGYSSRGEIEAILADVLPDGAAFETWCPDLPGMGESIATTVDSAREVVDLLCELVEHAFDGRRFVIVGHSLGGYLARAVAARMPARVAAMVLLCPLPTALQPEPSQVVDVEPGAVDVLDAGERAEFEGYFVHHTAAMVERFRIAVSPSLDRYDGEIVGRIMESSDEAVGPEADDVPTLVMLGRRDSLIGWRSQATDAASWPRATVAVVEDAGHALPHEKPALVRAMLADLLARVD